MSSDVMKVSASFQYDRYIAGKANSFDIFNRNNNNLNPLQPQNTPSAPQSAEDIYRASQETFTFGTQTNQTLQTASESLSASPLSTQANPETLF
jgi:hypothetical protein